MNFKNQLQFAIRRKSMSYYVGFATSTATVIAQTLVWGFSLLELLALDLFIVSTYMKPSFSQLLEPSLHARASYITAHYVACV